jgi:hypothetical protein
MTSEAFVSLVAGFLEALIAVTAISGGLYLFWKAVRRGSIPQEHVAAIMALILFIAVVIFLFIHFVKGS